MTLISVYYWELLTTFAPWPITCEQELIATQNRIDFILDKPGITSDDRAYIAVLGALVHEYEASIDKEQETTTKEVPVSKYYLELLQRFPPRLIKNEKDLLAANDRIEELLNQETMSQDDWDFIDVITTLTYYYEEHQDYYSLLISECPPRPIKSVEDLNRIENRIHSLIKEGLPAKTTQQYTDLLDYLAVLGALVRDYIDKPTLHAAEGSELIKILPASILAKLSISIYSVFTHYELEALGRQIQATEQLTSAQSRNLLAFLLTKGVLIA